MAKKKSSKKSDKPSPPLPFGGHRDLAEILSADYFIIANKTGWQTIPQLLNMDRLTDMLQEVPADILDKTIVDRWAQAFLMGMLHQTIVGEAIAMMRADEDEQE